MDIQNLHSFIVLRIEKLIEPYGNVAEKPYDQKTGANTKHVNDLQGDYYDNVTLLGINSWDAELQWLKIEFSTLKNSCYSDETAKPQENLNFTRKESDISYFEIPKRINELVEVNNKSNNPGFINYLKQRIINYNNQLTQLQG